MKIGLMTIYQVFNYGSVLQAFATQSLFEKLGADCVILNYQYPNKWHIQFGEKPRTSLQIIARKLFPSRKQKIFWGFQKQYFNFSKLYKDLVSLERENWQQFDAIVIGSDQVWNYRFTHADKVFLLSFVPEEIKKFSIASSFAQKSLPEELIPVYKRELSKFIGLSVREENGIDIIKRQLKIDKPVQVLLDPTLLLSRDEWMSRFSISKVAKVKSYILYYMWSYAFEPRPYIFEVVKHFRNALNCDVIALEGYADKENTNGVEMYDMSNSSIPKFIELFANASLVITSSFHGTAFALNFAKPLVSIVPPDESDDRQTSLIKKLGVNNCIVRVGDQIDSIDPFYNVDTEQQRLNELRNESIGWISKMILGK